MYEEFDPSYDWEELIEKNIEKDLAENRRHPDGESATPPEKDAEDI